MSDWGDADLNRPASPILHDYKPSARPQAKKPNALHWFAVGLGLPLLGIALLLALRNTAAPAATHNDTAPAAEMIVAAVESLPAMAEAAPVIEPVPFPARYPGCPVPQE